MMKGYSLREEYKSLREYISVPNNLEGLAADQGIATLNNPMKGASTDTMRRWIKEIYAMNNVVDFSLHSCWTASTNKAKRISVDVDKIIHRGCWQSRKSFFKFYDKEIG